MTDSSYSRHIQFEGILNFRDLGGYRTQSGNMVAWRKVFRSGELHHMTAADLDRLKTEVQLASVIDLREKGEIDRDGLGLLPQTGVRYHNVPFSTAQVDRAAWLEALRRSSDIGQIYLFYLSFSDYAEHIVQAMRLTANEENHPLAFHCSAGKDRTGVLAALVLSILGVSDEDIIADYALTAPAMPAHIRRLLSRPETAAMLNALPRYADEAKPESMAFFLSTMRNKYGSLRGYLEVHGADSELFEQLKRALLV